MKERRPCEQSAEVKQFAFANCETECKDCELQIIQDSENPDGRSETSPVSEVEVATVKSTKATEKPSTKQFQDSGFCVVRNEANTVFCEAKSKTGKK